MTVAYNGRTLPLAVNAGNPLAASIALAYDFTGVDSAHMSGVPWIYQGSTSPNLVATGTQTLTTANGEPGRVAGGNSLYDYTNTTDYGLQVGAGDFTIAIRISTPATLPTTSNGREVLRISGSAGTALSITLLENPSNGWYITGNGSSAVPFGATQSAVTYNVNTTLIVWVQRIAGFVTVSTQNATTGTAPSVRYATGTAATAPMDSTWAARFLSNYTSTTAITPALNSITFWRTGLTTANITSIGADYYALNANGAAADTVAITSVAANGMLGSTAYVSGTYSGTKPTGIDLQFNGGAWVTGTGMTIGGGTWAGNFALVAGTGTLQARETQTPATLSASLTGIIVTSDTLAFTAPPSSSDQRAVAYRLYQRNAAGQASVRIVGTYTGSPTGIQYQWGGTWQTLVASPSGGTFDQTVTLTGPGQAPLALRFTNTPGVGAALPAISVGDLFIVGGQSNHVGGGNGDYVAPAAPSGNPTWVATEFDKVGVWRPNYETATDPFSKITNATGFPTASAEYAVEGGGNAWNTYFGQLATLSMADGVPIAFVPCAMGSTSIQSWAASSATNTLYGAMVARAQEVGAHKAVLWWQGEYNTSDSTTNASYQSMLNAVINDWHARFPASKWVLMNINATGNGTGSGGAGSTDTGFNAIHAAIAAVASGNSYVASIADMNGAFSTSIHYTTAAEIASVASRAYTAIKNGNYAIPPATSASVTFVDAGGNAIANLTSLKWAFHDQATPDLWTAPTAKGATGTTDASGKFSANITGTTLLPGATGWLVVTDSDGTTTQSPAERAFSGPVTVA